MLTLLSKTDEQRDENLSALARDAAIAAITTGAPAFQRSGTAIAAVALLAVLPEAAPLSHGERSLLRELLDRLANVVE